MDWDSTLHKKALFSFLVIWTILAIIGVAVYAIAALFEYSGKLGFLVLVLGFTIFVAYNMAGEMNG